MACVLSEDTDQPEATDVKQVVFISLNFPLVVCIVCANREGSGETVDVLAGLSLHCILMG